MNLQLVEEAMKSNGFARDMIHHVMNRAKEDPSYGTLVLDVMRSTRGSPHSQKILKAFVLDSKGSGVPNADFWKSAAKFAYRPKRMKDGLRKCWEDRHDAHKVGVFSLPKESKEKEEKGILSDKVMAAAREAEKRRRRQLQEHKRQLEEEERKHREEERKEREEKREKEKEKMKEQRESLGMKLAQSLTNARRFRGMVSRNPLRAHGHNGFGS